MLDPSKIKRRPGSIQMPVTEWFTIKDNPRQRNTELHAQEAEQLKHYSPAQDTVHMAITPNGQRWKLEGHTRAWLWEHDPTLRRPEFVEVIVYDCDDEETVAQFIAHFNDPRQSFGARHIVQGAARATGIQFKSTYMKSGKYTSAYRTLYNYLVTTDWPTNREERANVINTLTDMYKEELLTIDKIEPNVRYFRSGVLAGAIAIVSYFWWKEADKVTSFLVALNKGEGEKTGAMRDGVQALVEMIDAIGPTANKKRAKAEASARRDDMFRTTLTAYENYRKGVKVQSLTGMGKDRAGRFVKRLKINI